jgi:poly(3-hydroxybutyrate) depolymerase
LAGAEDDITTKEQVFDADKYLGTPQANIVIKLASGGHIGLFMGTKTLSECWPDIAYWIRSGGRPVASRGSTPS